MPRMIHIPLWAEDGVRLTVEVCACTEACTYLVVTVRWKTGGCYPPTAASEVYDHVTAAEAVDITDAVAERLQADRD